MSVHPFLCIPDCGCDVTVLPWSPYSDGLEPEIEAARTPFCLRLLYCEGSLSQQQKGNWGTDYKIQLTTQGTILEFPKHKN